MRRDVAFLKPCRGSVRGAVGACTLWGESVERAEGAFLYVGSVCLDGLGVWAWVLPSAKYIANNHAHIFGPTDVHISIHLNICVCPHERIDEDARHALHRLHIHVAVSNSII